MNERNNYHRRTYKSVFVPRMSDKYENFIKDICGTEWRISSSTDVDGALGVAICKSIIEGSGNSLNELANRLGIDEHTLWGAYDRLEKNGYLKKERLLSDKSLIKGDTLAWCYVAGAAGGATGICS
ncbi:MAG: MarR family winged helix-turn-helix transcriptional regulator [Candidatus Woesearchaeota archaeon]